MHDDQVLFGNGERHARPIGVVEFMPGDIVAQINVYPMDVRHLEYLLPHQIRVWADMVDRIVITIDTHRSRSGRYRGTDYDSSLKALRRQIAVAQTQYPKLEAIEVDYSQKAREDVARYFFNADSIPVKAWDGGPFYAYFFGIYSAQARYVMHFDGDMMFGGGSKIWMKEAIALLESRPDIMLVSPFPGPPRVDGRIFGHQIEDGYQSVLEPGPSLAYRFSHASTRVFLIDLERFKSTLGTLPLLASNPLQKLKSWILGNPPEAREAEVILSHVLSTTGLKRIDILGSDPGLWGLHPPYRSEEFYQRLPEIVRMVELGNVPDGQRGHYDLNDSIINWTDQRAAARWHRRYYRLLRDRLGIN